MYKYIHYKVCVYVYTALHVWVLVCFVLTPPPPWGSLTCYRPGYHPLLVCGPSPSLLWNMEVEIIVREYCLPFGPSFACRPLV